MNEFTCEDCDGRDSYCYRCLIEAILPPPPPAPAPPKVETLTGLEIGNDDEIPF